MGWGADDLDHEMDLSQTVKYFTLGRIKGSYMRHDVGTQEEDLSPSQVAYGQRKTGQKPGTFVRQQQTPLAHVK